MVMTIVMQIDGNKEPLLQGFTYIYKNTNMYGNRIPVYRDEMKENHAYQQYIIERYHWMIQFIPTIGQQ